MKKAIQILSLLSFIGIYLGFSEIAYAGGHGEECSDQEINARMDDPCAILNPAFTWVDVPGQPCTWEFIDATTPTPTSVTWVIDGVTYNGPTAQHDFSTTPGPSHYVALEVTYAPNGSSGPVCVEKIFHTRNNIPCAN